MKLSDMFQINQGHQITDEEIYIAVIREGKIPILTAKNEVKGFWDKSIVNETDLPCITYPTKANSGVCFVQKSVFDANNTAVLIPKDEWRDKLVLEWIVLKLSKIFLDVATSKEGVNYLNKEIVEDIELDIPKIETQETQYNAISRLLELKRKIELVFERIDRITRSTLVFDYEKFQGRDVSVKQVFDYVSGNSGLTEEYIYTTSQCDSENETKYGVLTGSVDIENIQHIGLRPKPKSRKDTITVYSGEGIHVVRKGIFAGTIHYLPINDYTLNDDTYVITLKENSTYELSLKWVTIVYQNLFSEHVSGSDNNTWSKTSFFNHAKIDIPSKNEQDSIVNKFGTLEGYEKILKQAYDRIEEILEKEII